MAWDSDKIYLFLSQSKSALKRYATLHKGKKIGMNSYKYVCGENTHTCKDICKNNA